MLIRFTFHIELVSFKNIDIRRINGPITIKFGAYVQIGQNIVVAAPRAPSGGWGPRPPQKLVMGLCLLGNCYLENKFHIKIKVDSKFWGCSPILQIKMLIPIWRLNIVKDAHFCTTIEDIKACVW